MADERIEDITGGELTAIAADDKFVVLDKSDTTDDADGTSKFIEAATMGILETNNQTITTTDVTGAVGQLYVCTIAGLTANRNLTLPSASAGDRIGVHVLDGDDTYALILIGAASQTINGGSAATEWSRVFIQGETVVFRCVAANTWIVEQDSRIPSGTELTRAAAQSISNVTTVKILVDTVGYNIGNIGDATTNDRVDIRRAGRYAISGNCGFANIDDAERVILWITINGSVEFYAPSYSSTTNAFINPYASQIRDLSAGDYIELNVYHNEGASQNTHTNTELLPRLQVNEIL